MPFVAEPDGNAVGAEGPQLLDQAIVEFPGPLARQERHDLVAALEEFRPVSPMAVRRIGQRHPLGVAAVPAVLGGAHLLRRLLFGERRIGRGAFGHCRTPALSDRTRWSKPAWLVHRRLSALYLPYKNPPPTRLPFAGPWLAGREVRMAAGIGCSLATQSAYRFPSSSTSCGAWRRAASSNHRVSVPSATWSASNSSER